MRINFPYFWLKTYYPHIPKQIISKYFPFKGPPTETVMFGYFAFKGGPQQQLQFEGNLLSKGPQPPLKCVSTLLSNFMEGAPKRN